ncbi:hypothetical protein P692DRAFT_20872481 [Suillus brevipes Sb2]|nr:hypothetical protein P692DRAFT_20872481 [Suillus brevipes Sb2]
MTGQLNIFVREEKVFTSLTASFLPDKIPYEPVWDPQDNHDTSPDDSTSPLTTLSSRSWHITSRLYRGSNRPWMALLIDHPTCPIPAEWVHELSRLFVGDLSANVPCTGVIIPSNRCPWELQLPMYERFSIPVWVFCKQDSAFDLNLRHYHPSKEAIARAIEEQRLAVARAIEGQRICETTWGQDNGWGQDNNWGQDNDTWGKQADTTQSGSALGWDVNAFATQPAPGTALEAPQVDPAFPAPQRLSGQKSGEDWKTFFARRGEENLKKEEKESPVQR